MFEGYMKGVTAFVDKYWKQIHLAAGWGALRVLLLVSTQRTLHLTLRLSELHPPDVDGEQIHLCSRSCCPVEALRSTNYLLIV